MYAYELHTPRDSQAYMSFQERAQIFKPLNCHAGFQRLHSSVSGFLSCLSVALCALAGQRGGWGWWCEGQAAGHRLRSHLISAGALGLRKMTTTGHTFIISDCLGLLGPANQEIK